jgi:N4-gp56 family major capsid protein
MATPTDFGRLSTAQKKVWLAELWQAGRDESFWFSKGFIGSNSSDMNSPIQRITALTETERGMECVMQLVDDLQGDGTVGDQKLEDNEEQAVNQVTAIKIDQLRHGVRSKGEMAEQATVIRFRETAKGKLQFWLPDKLDELMFLTLSGRAYTLKTDGSTRSGSQLPQLTFAADVVAATPNRILFGGSATAENDVTVNDKMSWSVIVSAKSKAIRKKLRPIKDGGKGYYAVVMTPEQERDLVMDPTYQTIVSRAAEKGSKNPLFTGALAVVQGVILYSHNKVFNTMGLASASKWGSAGTVDGAQALLIGAQAGGLATLGNMFMRESDNTDYGNRPGIAVGRKLGMLKPQFKSQPDGGSLEDFGVISIKTAAAA